MPCAGCPEPPPRKTAGVEVLTAPPASSGAGPFLVDSVTMPVGTRLLPHGEPTIVLYVERARLHAGYAAVAIGRGEQHRDVVYGRAVKLLGPSELRTVERTPRTIGLYTSSAVEVSA